MKQTAIAILLSLSSGWSICQTKFYLAPAVAFKNSIAFVDPADLNNNEKNIFENQYFYQPYSVAFNSRYVKRPNYIDGLVAGIQFKNDTRLLSLSYHRDGAYYRAHSYFRPYFEESHAGTGISYYGIRINRITLTYSMKISDKKNLLKSWFSIGIGSYINRNGWTSILPVIWNMPLNPNGDLLFRTYVQPFEERRTNGFIKIGFENDFFLKKKYLLSLNAYFIKGIGVISRIGYVHEYILNGELVYSGVGLMSRGSGVYLEISRRFQIYPRKKKNITSIAPF